MGTTLNMTQYLLVKVTSPLTFNIVGFSKSLVQSLGGIVLMGDKTSFASLGGIGLSMLGSGLYTKAKATQLGKAPAAAVPVDDLEDEEDSEAVLRGETELTSLDSQLKARQPAFVTSHSVETVPSPSALVKAPVGEEARTLQS